MLHPDIASLKAFRIRSNLLGHLINVDGTNQTIIIHKIF